nr:MAG TPA: hypothetical protein [Caudoviricetes sp.]
MFTTIFLSYMLSYSYTFSSIFLLTVRLIDLGILGIFCN